MALYYTFPFITDPIYASYYIPARRLIQRALMFQFPYHTVNTSDVTSSPLLLSCRAIVEAESLVTCLNEKTAVVD